MPGPRPTAPPSEPNRKPVTEEVMELLRQAGAPDPPAWLGALTDLTGIVNVVAELRGGVPASPEVKLRRRAQRAINELRLLLPQLVLWSHHHENNPSLLTCRARRRKPRRIASDMPTKPRRRSRFTAR